MGETGAERDDAEGLIRVLTNIRNIREVSHEKRVLLMSRAQKRTGRKKVIYVVSGSLALLSGGTASALVAPAADVIGVKIMAAALAFVSGVISLVTTAFFDEKETAKMNEGAGRYGELRDRADVILGSRVRQVKELDAIFNRLTEQQSKLQQEFDQWIDVTTIQARSAAIQAKLNAEATAQLRALAPEGGQRSERSEARGRSDDGGGAASIMNIVTGPVFSKRLDNF
jgi:hypothetical protein